MAILGVQMFTLREFTQNEEDLAATLRSVRDMGYRSIQISAFGPIPAGRIQQLCADMDLDIAATHVSWDRLQSELDLVIEEHLLWDCRHTAVGMIPPEQYLSRRGLAQFLVEAEPVIVGLQAAGISFSYHNHHHEFQHFDGQTWLQTLLQRAPDIKLNLELDTHWIVAGGADPVDWIDKAGHCMPLLHLKDFCLDSKNKRRFAAIGQGNLNWVDILAEAGKHPIEYYLVEQDNCYGEDPFECLSQSFEFLSGFGLS